MNFAQSISVCVCVHVYECNSSRIFRLTIVCGYRFYKLLIGICSKLKSLNGKTKFKQINWPRSSICHYGHSFILFSSTLREKKHSNTHNTCMYTIHSICAGNGDSYQDKRIIYLRKKNICIYFTKAYNITWNIVG